MRGDTTDGSRQRDNKQESSWGSREGGTRRQDALPVVAVRFAVPDALQRYLPPRLPLRECKACCGGVSGGPRRALGCAGFAIG